MEADDIDEEELFGWMSDEDLEGSDGEAEDEKIGDDEASVKDTNHYLVGDPAKYEISMTFTDHLFPEDSLFRSIWSL